MRKMLASAVLCLLLLLSVGSLRCEALCSAMAMPKSSQANASAVGNGMEMAGMEHCAAMHSDSTASEMGVSCSHVVCSHESLPALSDAAPVRAVWTTAAVVMPMAGTVKQASTPAEAAETPPLFHPSPLSQSSMLRV